MPIIEYNRENNYINSKINIFDEYVSKLLGPGNYKIIEKNEKYIIRNIETNFSLKVTQFDLSQFELEMIPKAY